MALTNWPINRSPECRGFYFFSLFFFFGDCCCCARAIFFYFYHNHVFTIFLFGVCFGERNIVIIKLLLVWISCCVCAQAVCVFYFLPKTIVMPPKNILRWPSPTQRHKRHFFLLPLLYFLRTSITSPASRSPLTNVRVPLTPTRTCPSNQVNS